MKSTKDTPHHKKCRELMKKNYYEKDGKTKSALKYYKRKFRGIGESSVPDDAGGGNWVLEGREEGASKM